MIVKALHPDQTMFLGDHVAAVDSTAGQFMKVSTADAYTPCDAADDLTVGILYKDAAADAPCTVLCGGLLEIETIAGSPAVGDQIEIATSGFATKKASGAARGLITGGAAGAWEVFMYAKN